MANASEKIALYNLADLKNTADDAIPNYLNSLKFKQSHHLTDVRLGLGYSAFLLGAACFGWDYKLGYESTKYYTAAAVAIYMLLNGALTLWMTVVEKGIVYQGATPSGEQISISTSTKKNEPIYRLAVTVTSKGSKPRTFELSKPFAEFYNELGYFVATPFQEFFATSIPIIGKMDPKRIKIASQEMLDTNPDLLNAVLAANAVEDTTGSSTTGADSTSKGGKRRKA